MLFHQHFIKASKNEENHLEKFKKIAILSLLVICAIGLLLSLGFVNKEQDKMRCQSLDIQVDQNGDLYFLDRNDIEKLIKSRGDSIQGEPKASLNVTALEKALNSHADIANAEVSVSIDGKVKVRITQRKPIVRIINETGDSYYMDDEGKLMPLSDKYTAKVLIANGKIPESYGKHYKQTMEDIAKDSSVKAHSMLDEVFAMATYIEKSEFWSAQIQQIYINDDKEMELVPMVGNQKIIFGDTTAMDEKFKKLLTFYAQGLNTTGWWNKYATINLKFKNQIVCTKKE
jgi:cell division protein FtsQ